MSIACFRINVELFLRKQNKSRYRVRRRHFTFLLHYFYLMPMFWESVIKEHHCFAQVVQTLWLVIKRVVLSLEKLLTSSLNAKGKWWRIQRKYAQNSHNEALQDYGWMSTKCFRGQWKNIPVVEHFIFPRTTISSHIDIGEKTNKWFFALERNVLVSDDLKWWKKWTSQ